MVIGRQDSVPKTAARCSSTEDISRLWPPEILKHLDKEGARGYFPGFPSCTLWLFREKLSWRRCGHVVDKDALIVYR